MLFGWFNATDANRFGAELAQHFIDGLPLDTRKTDKKFAAKAQRLLNRLDVDVQRFKATHKLNVYSRAKLGQQFKWTLKDAGYDEAYINELTEWLVKRL